MTDAAAPRIEVRLTSDERGAVAYLTVDNRRKLNTLDRALMTDFVRLVEALAGRDDLRALVLTGAGGKAFIGAARGAGRAGCGARGARRRERQGLGCAARGRAAGGAAPEAAHARVGEASDRSRDWRGHRCLRARLRQRRAQAPHVRVHAAQAL